MALGVGGQAVAQDAPEETSHDAAAPSEANTHEATPDRRTSGDPAADAAGPDEAAETSASDEPEMSAEEAAALEALLADPTGEATAVPDVGIGASSILSDRPIIQLYGFLDFGYQYYKPSKTSFESVFLPTTGSSFVLGNINLFLDIQPDPGWRSLVELRFTQQPHGQDDSFEGPGGTGEYSYIDRRYFDTTSSSGRNDIIVGGVVIERAWSEYSFADELNLRGGYFFTPYGIWNVDHGTPTLLSLLLPDAQVTEVIPQQQVGVMAHGRTLLGDYMLGYHAYVGNGRTPGLFDLSHDKAVGGRLTLSPVTFGGELELGFSGYWGKYLEQNKRIDNFVDLSSTKYTKVAYSEYALVADLTLDWEGLRVRTEVAMQYRKYDDGAREPTVIPGTFMPDRYYWNAYTIIGYRLPFWGLEPYLYGEVLHVPSLVGDTIVIPSVGFNIHFTARAQLKTQVAFALRDNVSQDDSFLVPGSGFSDITDPSLTIVSSRFVLAY